MQTEVHNILRRAFHFLNVRKGFWHFNEKPEVDSGSCIPILKRSYTGLAVESGIDFYRIKPC